MNELMVFERREQAIVSSRVIAEMFNKRHRDITTTIDKKIISLKKSTAEKFAVKDYFIYGKYEHNGNWYKEYFLTRNGFSFIVMGFTGEKADLWKIKYIDAFNQMEKFIKERQSTEWLQTRKQGKLVRRSETDRIQELIPYAEEQGSTSMQNQAYTVYSKLVNKLVGISAGERDKISFKTISTIMFLEDMIMNTIKIEMAKKTHYKDIYKLCKRNGELIIPFAYLENEKMLTA